MSSKSSGNTMQAITDEINPVASRIREIDARAAYNDEVLLAEIGYKQELKRKFSTFQIFGIAFSIMGLLPSISSTAASGLSSGPSGFLWSWLIASFFIFCVGLSISELGSAIPTSGGLYYWTYYYAPQKCRIVVSFVIGLSNSLALCSGLVSMSYGNAQEILAAVYITKDGNFKVTQPKTYGVFACCVFTQALCTCLSSKKIALMQSVSYICNTGLIVLFLIVLPVGTSINRNGFNDAKFIFGTVQNYSDWPIGFQFFLSMMTAVWTIGGFDSCIHMSEEAKNASYGVPIGVCGSISFTGFLGFFIIICTTACMDPEIIHLLESKTGFPMAQIIYDSLGKRWAIAMMSLIAVCQWFMGASLLASLSRQLWAFARDNALPFSSIVRVVDKRLKVPIRGILFGLIVALILGCLCLGGTTVAFALFSLGVCGNYLAWGAPIFFKLTSGKDRFHPGSFYLGNLWSKVVGWIACLWCLFIIIITMIPSTKHVTKSTMNYTVVIAGPFWILSIVYFYVYRKRFYHGPKSTIEFEYI
ncbi:unnamed protein product [Ambrosiozyma monospora]|uniref:Unnamed protein product n=1 Tax=Ambrosiozyma monospora TaxID=43982 RepID=A0A9W6YKN1_AMBMO|nr:unnamed protein product [Ambrosiozyma monospora]